MPANLYQPPGTEKRRWPQFSLRSMLVLVAGVALLMSQYPFFETVPLSGAVQWTAANQPITEIVAPTRGFVLVSLGEIAVFVAWLGYRDMRVDWARRATRQVGED